MTAPTRWYHRPWCLIVALTLFGPLALPLLWSSPHLKRSAKWLISAGVLLLTVWLAIATVRLGVLVSDRLKEYPDLRDLMRTESDPR